MNREEAAEVGSKIKRERELFEHAVAVAVLTGELVKAMKEGEGGLVGLLSFDALERLNTESFSAISEQAVRIYRLGHGLDN